MINGGIKMIYLNSVLSFKHCPYCGKNILTDEGIKPCKHLIAVFTTHSFNCDGCLFMSEVMRKMYYPNYILKYTSDAVLDKIVGEAKIRQIVKDNNYVVYNLRSKEPDMYEWPIIKFIFDEPEYC